MLNYCRIDLTHFGEVDGLQLNRYPMPSLTKGQVLIKTHYSGINPIDVKTRAGLGWAAQQNADRLPWALGYDAAGQVIAVGEGVDEAWLGQPVCGMLGFPLEAGCYGSVRATDVSDLQVIPQRIHPMQAAALPLAGLTAHQALFEHGQAKAGQRVLILGASGGVGHLALQLAADAGCEVIAVASAQRGPLLQQLGANQALDYRSDWLEGLAPVDLLLDLVGGDAGIQAVAKVKASGRVVTVPTVTADDVIAAAKSRTIDATGMLVHPCGDSLQHLLQLVSDNKLTIEVDSCYPAQSVAEAHLHLEQGQVCGKLVLNWCQ
ncbi:NADP-dependent oxidoreductase [Neiella marina]|uniref:NADP-dependent oxidoreductase n=1 Tax=Neiella holothuriorum TaxID=2870530 RepID=A0ABS7EKE8_9GAMM|nr:NADP-dependent oxidoreductase [Neiella holothuriorum]MBW8192796.1 NADP-dependent oxidoreductase [Neiella holothuriorum]